MDAIYLLALVGLFGCAMVLWAIAPEMARPEPRYWTTYRF